MWQGVVNLKDDFLTRFWVILVQFMMLFVRIVQLLSALQQRDVASPVAIELHVFFSVVHVAICRHVQTTSFLGWPICAPGEL